MKILVFIFFLLTSLIIYIWLKRKIYNNRAISQRVVLTYADQNFLIEQELPKTGVIHSKIRIGKTNDNFIVQLDIPMKYGTISFSEIVIRHRHVNHFIGSASPIHVHLLLPKVKLAQDTYQFDDFNHAAWLIVERA